MCWPRAAFLRARRENAARAVIFEGPPYEPHARGKKSGGERVAVKACIALAIELERQRAVAVDEARSCEPVRLRGLVRPRRIHEPPDGVGKLTARISWVRVLRVTRSQLRQPEA